MSNKITVEDERVFPTLGIIAQAGDIVEVPNPDAVTSSKSKAKPAEEVKDGDI